MPTSSQALILFNNEKENERNHVTSKTRSYFSLLRTPARVSVANVYNINGFYSIPVTELKDSRCFSFLSAATAQLYKYYKLPRGFRSVLSYDPLTKSFCWRILGGQEASPYTEGREDDDDEEIENEEVEGVLEADEEEVLEKTQLSQETASYPPETTVSFRRKRPTIDKDLYDRLVDLGFRASSFEVRRGSCTKDKETTQPARICAKFTFRRYLMKKEPSLTLRQTVSAHQKPTISEPPKPTTSELYKPKQTIRTTEERTPQELVSSPNTSEDDEDDVDDESDRSLDEDVDADGFYRILPSLCMRKEMPLCRPRSAIFSFRDNEERSHEEVRDLILEQTGLKITGLQFDPLNIRASKPKIRSRWIVDFGSAYDLDMFIGKGLETGKDRMIIYKYDDIAKREFASFKYYKTIQDAKKCLKGSRREKHTDKSKKVNKLRETSSLPVRSGGKIIRKRSHVN